MPYIPGQDCKCAAKSEIDCCCNVDWTPAEVYKLRTALKEIITAFYNEGSDGEIAVKMLIIAKDALKEKK